MLSQKASKIADRKIHVDEMAEPKAFMNIKSDSKPSPDPMLAMEKRMMDKMTALIAQGQNQHVHTVPAQKEKTDKKKSKNEIRKEKWKDPEYRAKVANQQCFIDEKYNNCVRPNCPFLPCNKNSTSKTFYSKDF